jgi:protein O-mannosyl-transferase
VSGIKGYVLGIILVAATLLAYQPAWNAGFIWDDDVYVTNNPLLTAPDGLARIWCSLDSPSQYFPLTYTTFRVERGLWGLDAAGYHWVNLLLHAVNALLVWQLLARLGLPGAWLAAALFALHPVQVESVAWITERKNVLSLFFSLLALHAWIGFLRPAAARKWYVLALVSYLLALLSKTTACTLPAALILVLWLKYKPLNWRRWMQVAPFVLLGLLMGLVTVWWEHYHQGTRGEAFSMSLPARILLASHAIWFYLGKLLWPANLMFSYPRWVIQPANPFAWSWLLAAGAAAAVVWLVRRRLGRGLESALLFYAATLSPVLGFIMLYTFKYSFVADHYQYAACIGPLALIAAGLASVPRGLQKAALSLRWGLCAALLTGLSFLTWQQCRVYHDAETLWRATAARNPGSGLAQLQLGKLLAQEDAKPEALAHFWEALRLWNEAPDLSYDIANILLRKGWLPEAVDTYRMTLKHRPDDAEAHLNLGTALFQSGRIDEAVGEMRRALNLRPGFTQALNNLSYMAWTLTTSTNPAVWAPSKAVRLAEETDRVSGGTNASVARILAAAYGGSGRFAEAASAAQRGLDLAVREGNAPLAASLLKQLESCQARLTNAASGLPAPP